MTAPILAYTVHTSQLDSSNYRHAYIEIFELARKDFINRGKISLQWQTDHDSTDSTPWYAAKIETPNESPDQIREAVKMMNRVMKPIDWTYDIQPEIILDRLERMKAVHLIRDDRESAYLEPKDIKPASYSRYIDDYNAIGKTSCTASVMATNETDAKRDILPDLANCLSDEKLIQWVRAGKPVINTSETGYSQPQRPQVKAPADLLETF